MKTLVLLAAAAAILSGCTSPQQHAATMCESYGFTPGTPLFEDCFQRQMDRSLAASSALMGAGLGLYNASSYQPRVWTGTCSSVGGSTFCNGTR